MLHAQSDHLCLVSRPHHTMGETPDNVPRHEPVKTFSRPDTRPTSIFRQEPYWDLLKHTRSKRRLPLLRAVWHRDRDGVTTQESGTATDLANVPPSLRIIPELSPHRAALRLFGVVELRYSRLARPRFS